MKHLFIHHVMAVIMIITILATSTPLVYAKNTGAIWTTRADCGEEQQDVNHYEIGEMVTINGANFEPNTTYTWTITGQPGGASADPNTIVATGTLTTDATGAFCIPAYVVAADDDGEYTVDIPEAKKNDNYRVRGVEPTPTGQPTPTIDPTPTVQPTPTAEPTPTTQPEPTQTPMPTGEPTEVPQEPSPTAQPSPTRVPSPTPENRSITPTTKPASQPTAKPTTKPTSSPQKNTSSTQSTTGTPQSSGTSGVQGVKSFPGTGSAQSNGTPMLIVSTDTSATQTRLVIPKLELVKPLYFATVTDNQYQVRNQDVSDALYDGTRMLYGHNTDQVFRNLGMLQSGDAVYLQRTGMNQKYLVSRIEVLPETEIEAIAGLGKGTLVLTTCLPADESKRIVVYAERSAY
jgi:LPXTG-site transpeptidase (sortase) family protein